MAGWASRPGGMFVHEAEEPAGFVAAAEVARSARAVRRDLTRLTHTTSHALRHVGVVATWLRKVPVLPLTLSHDDAGRTVLDGLSRFQPWPVRYRAVAVIELPGHFEDYLRGRSMQAVRTNRSHARRHGLSVVAARSTHESETLLRTMVKEHAFDPITAADMWDKVAAARWRTWFVLGPAGVPIGMAAVVVDRDVAQLALLQLASDYEHRSAARFLLSTELVRDLVDVDCRVLLADSMLVAAPGVVYLERRLGFRPMHVKIPRRTRRWYRYGSRR